MSRPISAAVAAPIEAHLADCASCRRLAFALVLESDRPRAKTHGDSPELIDRFQVIASLGRGAMGQVYRAFDPERGRHVAIKVRRGHARLGIGGEVRLRREAEALARLTHPNVVAVHEAGRHDHTAYVAMEYVEGVTLDVWLSTPRAQSAVIELFTGLGRGLAAAHAAGLVHRDVEPRNVLVSKSGLAKLGDFGLVRADSAEPRTTGADRGGQAPGSADLTMMLGLSGPLLATPAYMAPEQLRGEIATEASDQFGFCVTLYEALYGRRPFAGRYVQELLLAMARGHSLPRTPRVPERLQRVLTRGLEFDPERRFDSMSALLAELSRPIGHRVAVGASGVAAALAVVVTHAVAGDVPDLCSVRDRRAEQVFSRDRRQAVEATLSAENRDAMPAVQAVGRLLGDYGERWHAANKASCRATVRGGQSRQLRDRQRACLERRLKRADDLFLVLSTPAQASVLRGAASAVEALPEPEACTRADATVADREPPPPNQAAAVAGLERRIDRVDNLEAVGQAALAKEEIEHVVSAARATRHSPLLARALLAQTSVYASLERFTEIEPLLEEAVSEAAKARDDELVARAWTMRVDIVAEHLGRVADGRRWVPVADAAVRRAGNPPELRARLHTCVGAMLMESGEYAQAKAELEMAVAIRERSQPSARSATAEAHDKLGTLLLREGRRADALTHFETALAILRRTYGDLHPDVLTALNDLGTLLAAEDPRRALAHLQEARTLGEKLLGSTSLSVATSLDSMGIARYHLGEYAAAAELHRQAHAIDLALLGPKHPKVGFALGNLGKALLALDDHAGAVDAYRQAVEILSATIGPHDARLARARSGLGDALERAGDADAAIAAYQESLASYEGGQDRGGEDAAVVRVQLAQLLAIGGKTPAACRQFEGAYRTLARSGENRGPAILALAGIVSCNAREHRIDRERLADLERAVTAAGALPPAVTAFASYARSRTYAALGDRTQALALAEASRDDFARAEMTARRDEVERWLKALQMNPARSVLPTP